MTTSLKNSFDALDTLTVGGKTYRFANLKKLETSVGSLETLPYAMKVLLENLVRREDGTTVTKDDILAFVTWLKERHVSREIAFQPARVLMQDFTGVPAVVDLAAMREAIKGLGGRPSQINPLAPVDLVIDHSVMVDRYASADAFQENVSFEYDRNDERYAFLKWGQKAFDNFRVVPPGTGICHQVNLEYLCQVAWTDEKGGESWVYPDTLVGTDSHTTMVNGLGVLGWGVGGIEAEAAMLGQPISMLIPDVIGFQLTGALPEGTTATDLVLTITQMLRNKGVVGKFVEFYGEGLSHLALADRATIGNMSPEFGATCALFPVDEETIRYLDFTGREAHRVALAEAYAKAQGFWRTSVDPVFTETLSLDLSTVEPTLAGPKRPQDKVLLSEASTAVRDAIAAEAAEPTQAISVTKGQETFDLDHGDVVIAAITSCTNTSNPSVMLGAGLIARKARERGLSVKPWVKTSLAPGSQVVTDYLEKADLQKDLDALGFHLVGYGCTTCIGNSGPLDSEIAQAIEDNALSVCAVLSGNRNFEGRIHPQVKLSYLASPMLVVAYALAGSLKIDLVKDPLGHDQEGQPVYLKDLWPTNAEIQACVEASLTPEMFRTRYQDVFKGDSFWSELESPDGETYQWQTESTYVKHPPFFEGMSSEAGALSDITDARVLAILGDSTTTDHISPAGAIKHDSPAGGYLQEKNISPGDFNSYGSRRGNHEVMMRGTFANIRLRNEMLPGTTGGVTRLMPEGTETSIFEASMSYQAEGTPLVVVAGCEYGTGSSRDWAAKGTRLLGVKAVLAESFERIHRSNLIGMGVLPLEFEKGVTRLTLGLTGQETFTITGIEEGLSPRKKLSCSITYPDGMVQTLSVLCRIDTENELAYYQNGGILHFVMRQLAEDQAA